jgi:division protein CdvB (Snf7/Vps24/ESCRT-III family)
MQSRCLIKESEIHSFQKIPSLDTLKFRHNQLQIKSILIRLQSQEIFLFNRLVEAIKNNDPSSRILAVEIQNIRKLVRKLQTFHVFMDHVQNISLISKNYKNLRLT